MQSFLFDIYLPFVLLLHPIFVLLCFPGFAKCDMAPKPGGLLLGQKWDYWDYNTAVHMGRVDMDAVDDPEHEASNANQNLNNKNRQLRGTELETVSKPKKPVTGNGNWYSFRAVDENKYWKNATIVKTINSDCQWRWLTKTVHTKGDACFSTCGSGSYNQSSACYIDCFFDTVLGTGSSNSTNPKGYVFGLTFFCFGLF